MRDTRPISDSEWMVHVDHTRGMLGDVLAAILIAVAGSLLLVLYFTPCQAGALC